MAHVMKMHLPVALLAMMEDNTWPGECLIVQGSSISRPTAAEISQNYVFVKPLVKVCQSYAPCFKQQMFAAVFFLSGPIAILVSCDIHQMFSRLVLTTCLDVAE